MRELRRWVPGPARDAGTAETPDGDARLEEPSAKDLAFCSELAVHGGVAVSEEGFGAEAELVRLREAGLLELQRDVAPPFSVMRVTLSRKARDILARRSRGVSSGGGTKTGEKTVAMPTSAEDRYLRRHGFAVARGMISAAVKAELASWNAAGEAGSTVTLETRILTRINQIEVPFPP